MGKKRIAKKSGGGFSRELASRTLSKLPKRKVDKGRMYIRATYNNTALQFTDVKGNVLMSSSAGAMGFRGARKGTPYAASRVANVLAEKAQMIGVKNMEIFVRGVGAGREAAIRTLVGSDIEVQAIRDITPIPHNGPRARKPRRV